MRPRDVPALLRLARGARPYLRSPVTPGRARRQLRERLLAREGRFLDVLRRLVYAVPASPWAVLLRAAGCELGDVERSVAADGLESTLGRLRDAGVRLGLEELKGRAPIVRGTLRLQVSADDFDPPAPRAVAVRGGTAGSSGPRPTRVGYTWEFLEEEASNELLLQEVHGVSRAPLALWFPGPPAIAGLHNLLLNVKLGRPPERWFSQLSGSGTGPSLVDRLAVRGLYAACASSGVRVPGPEVAPFARPDAVLDWTGRRSRRGSRAGTGPAWALKTYASSAARLADHTRSVGEDLAGGVVFCGGEPLTEGGRRALEAAGARPVPRYVATELGLVAAGCGRGTAPDGMHVYADRVAVIRGAAAADPGATTGGAAPRAAAGPLLWTSLSPHAPKVLLNADLGDVGGLRRRTCDCALGRLGFELEVAGVGGEGKLTAGGVTLLVSELDDVVGGLVRRAGGTPDDYQFWEGEAADGAARLRVAVNPDLTGVREDDLARQILARLRARGGAGAVTAAVWEASAALEVVRARPSPSPGSKMPRVLRS